MTFVRFIFSFLFVRNWHTGDLELSRSRMAIFSAGIFLILLSLTIITVLQTPLEVVK